MPWSSEKVRKGSKLATLLFKWTNCCGSGSPKTALSSGTILVSTWNCRSTLFVLSSVERLAEVVRFTSTECDEWDDAAARLWSLAAQAAAKGKLLAPADAEARIAHPM